MSGLEAVLDEVTRVRGVRGALLAGEGDGLVVAAAVAEGLDADAVAAMAASLMLRLRRAAQATGSAAPAFVQLRAERGALLAVPAGEELLLVAVAGPEAELGLARLALRAAAGRVG